MCGFAGSIGERILHRAAFVSHRGPSSHKKAQFGNLTVDFFRLAINGLENGDQPFYTPGENVLTCVNGEIYNHTLLREVLSNEGAEFSTLSDAEVVHWGYKIWNTGIFEKLEGMFAVAIFDSDSGILTLARDRLGKKPVYWCRKEDTICFSSEIMGLPPLTESFPESLLVEYLLTDGISWSEPSSPEIASVPAGTWVQITGSSKKIGTFWDLQKSVLAESGLKQSRNHWYRGFEEVVSDSVSQRLMSSVPVGVFLSNGKDSKLVSAYAARAGKIDMAYTLQFSEATYDESREAQNFAKLLRINHEMVPASMEDLLRAWQLYRDNIDEPFADSAILAQFLLAEAAAKSTPVVLTGDGGDELLLGYQHVGLHRLAQIPGTLALLQVLATSVQPLVQRNADDYFSGSFVIERFLRGATESSLVTRDLSWRSSFSRTDARGILKHWNENVLFDLLTRTTNLLPKGVQLAQWEDQWSTLCLKTYLENVVLRKVDRATMRFGVEARNPLLDRSVVEFVFKMPAKFRGNSFASKLPINFSLDRAVGKKHSRGKKHGMGVPLAKLLRGPLRHEVNQLADPEFLSHQNLFNQDSVQELVSSFDVTPATRAREIWSLIVFQAWWRRQYAILL